MHVKDYFFFKITATASGIVYRVPELLQALNAGQRVAYLHDLTIQPSRNVEIIIGIGGDDPFPELDMPYIGYVFAQFQMCPELTEHFEAPFNTDLTQSSCFLKNKPF
jgi:hypothetical protein